MRAVGEQPVGDEADGVVEERVRRRRRRRPGRRSTGRGSTRSGSRSCGLGAARSGRRGGGRGDHPAAGAGQPGAARRRRGGRHAGRWWRSSVGTRSRQAASVRLPGDVGVEAAPSSGVPRDESRTRSWWAPSGSSSVRVSATSLRRSACGRRRARRSSRRAVSPQRARPACRASSRARRAEARGGRIRRAGRASTSTRAVPWRAMTRRRITARSGRGGQGERFAAFDDGVGGDPAAAPDQAAGLVVPAPHEAALAG